jgi:hypothetical protein
LLLLDTEYTKFNAETKQPILDKRDGQDGAGIDPEGVGVACR